MQIRFDEFVVLSSHIHGTIILFVGADLRVCPNIVQFNKKDLEIMSREQYPHGEKPDKAV